MKRFILASALTLAFSCSASAGDIPTSGAPAPSGPTTSTQASETTPGDVPSDSKSDLSSEALSALLSALSFLGI
jgi:hypothetical protein